MNFKNISICLTLLVALAAVTAANATQKQIQSTDLVEQDADAANAGDDVNAADKKAATDKTTAAKQ